MDWKNITLKQFLLIQEAIKIEDETERLIRLSEIVFGDSVTNLSLQEYSKKIKELSFLNKEIPTNNLVKKYKVEDREYTIDSLLGNITTAQYLDYTNFAKANDFSKMLAVFFIPKGHKYNDGYDMEQVFKDIEELPITIANSMAFFFGRQFLKFMQIFQSSSIKKIKKMDIPKEKKEMMIKTLQSLQDLESYLTY